ncbi:hypothetical protein K502DRAFT_323492 [Neoconidiobolus thromboides FSU 785]|nr:hypothetical protein K502DRAFT_323492 [Neoconidiobolus thromboides FSU 785]
MAYKAGLEQWNLAVQTFEQNDLHGSLTIFEEMGGTAKIHFNIGVLYSLLGNYDLAISSYNNAIELDNYLAIAYFARALANLEINDIDSASEDFNDCLLYLRGNQHIDYFQLGLDFKLYSCEVLYNRGLCQFKLNNSENGMVDLKAAAKEKQQAHHDIINRAIDLNGKNSPMFRLPDGCLFRPCESMVKNTKKIDYLGQAKVIAANSGGPAMLSHSKTLRKFPEKAPTSTSSDIKPIATTLTHSKSVRNFASKVGEISTQDNNSFSIGLSHSKSMRVLPGKSPKSMLNLPANPALSQLNRSASALVSPRLLSRSDTLPAGSIPARSSARSTNLKLSNSIGDIHRFNSQRKSEENSENLEESEESYLKPIPGPGKATYPLTPSPLASSPEESYFLELSKPPSLTHSASSFNSPTLYDSETIRSRAPVPKGKMKIKCHFNDTRTLMVNADIKFKELQTKIVEKFSSELNLKLKYKDEDDELVLITDQEDLDMALASLCINSDGTMSHLDPESGFDGRFEVWCSL